MKDMAVRAVDACILGPIGALVLQALLSKPRNRIASWFAAILKALIETKQENPTMSVDELAKRMTELAVSVNELQVSLKAAFQLVGPPKTASSLSIREYAKTAKGAAGIKRLREIHHMDDEHGDPFPE
jgi:hypothetical protein